MKKSIVALIVAAGLTAAVAGGTARGQNPPPGPPAPPGGPSATATATSAPTATFTPVPTATPVPATVRLQLSHRTVKAGQQQGATVTTNAGAVVKLTVTYPNKKKDVISGSADSAGRLSYSFTQPSGMTSGKNRTVSVSASITFGAQSKHSTKKYAIG